MALRRKRGVGKVTLLVFGPTIFLIFSFANKWFFFYPQAHKNQFTDLRVITSNSECIITGQISNQWLETCDPWGRITNLPTIWVNLSAHIGILEKDTFAIGLLIGLLTLSFLGYFLYPYFSDFSRFQVLILLFGVVYSTPLFMLLERGNIDQIIFMFILAVVGTQVSKKSYIQVFGILLLAFSTYLKIFPVGGAFFLFVLKFRKRSFKQCALIAASQIVALITLYDQLSKIMKFSLAAPGEQFGLRSFPLWCLTIFRPNADANQTFLATSIAGIAIFISLAVPVFCIFTASNVVKGFKNLPLNNLESRNFMIFTLFGGCYFAAFFAGSNWYYRFVFLIPVVTALAHMIPYHATRILLATSFIFIFGAASSTPYLMMIMQLWATIMAVAIPVFLYLAIKPNKVPAK
jgi:hypothetical protein